MSLSMRPPLSRPEIKTYPQLDDLQIGHLRHFENLAGQPAGDWSRMGVAESGQEGLSSYRYQLAYMAYGLGLAHYHHLPAARGPMRELYQRIIAKMLHRDVWAYWRDTSQSGPKLDPDLLSLRDGWTDPVVRENIMYSGHLHAMTGLYAVLFDDDRYAEEGALSFVYDPRFYGMGTEVFAHDFRSLNETIYWQMVENGWLGVACEPNCIFIVCNQFPMLGFRFHDLRHGSQIAAEAVENYRAAWADKGVLTPAGNFIGFWRQRQDTLMPGDAGMDAWTGAVMNAWNGEFVRELTQTQILDALHRHPDGLVTPLADKLAADPMIGTARNEMPQGSRPDFGYFAVYLAEMGEKDWLDGLLAHADRHMAPTWEKGGLYYPRNDQPYDSHGHLTHVEPLTGNAMLGYARLNVPNGLRTVFERPWTSAHFEAPHLANAPRGVDVRRAWWDATARVLALGFRAREGAPATIDVEIAGLPPGTDWTLWRGTEIIGQSRRGAGPTVGDIEVGRDRLRVRTPNVGEYDLVLALEAA